MMILKDKLMVYLQVKILDNPKVSPIILYFQKVNSLISSQKIRTLVLA